MPLQIPVYDPVNSCVHEVAVDPPQWTLPVVGVDECANNREIGELTRALVRHDLAAMTMPVWQQLLRRADGKTTQYVGSSNHLIRERLELGKPVKGHSWSDKHVLWGILGHFSSSNTLVLVTENRKSDPEGLRRTLDESIAPVLERPQFARLSLTLLARRHGTSWQAYSELALNLFQQAAFRRGYNYIEI